MATPKRMLLGVLALLLISAVVVGVVLKLQSPQVPSGRVKGPALVVNTLRSGQIWPANVEHCPQSWTLGQTFLEKLLLIWLLSSMFCKSARYNFLPLTKGALGKHVRQFRKLSDLGKRLYACFISHLVTIHPDGPDTDCLRSTYALCKESPT